jgi:hypothetical protein
VADVKLKTFGPDTDFTYNVPAHTVRVKAKLDKDGPGLGVVVDDEGFVTQPGQQTVRFVDGEATVSAETWEAMQINGQHVSWGIHEVAA